MLLRMHRESLGHANTCSTLNGQLDKALPPRQVHFLSLRMLREEDACACNVSRPQRFCNVCRTSFKSKNHFRLLQGQHHSALVLRLNKKAYSFCWERFGISVTCHSLSRTVKQCAYVKAIEGARISHP